VSVNFDAKLSLDVSQFLSGVKKAEGALKSLETQLVKINSRNLSVGVGGGAIGGSASSSISKRRAEAALEQSLIEKMTKSERNNAKVQWEAEMMRQKSMDARLKDHQTMSSLYDQRISMDQKERKQASDAIKSQMMGREQNLRGIARERYALYDVAAAYAAVTAASIGTIKAVVGTAAQYERSFANVVRTAEFTSIKVGEAARVMRQELTELSNQIPVSFGQITEIATIGNQLGIAQADLVDFTDTVAKFAATTDVTIENAAMSFGRIGELLNVSDFNALGSAIAFAGVNAVATETQILAISKEIATTAKQAKFAAPDVIGLATALGSLGIAPEAARGSIIRSFAAINKAVGEGGKRLQAYASLSGISAEEFAGAWQTNGAKAFDALLQGLQRASNDGKNLDSVLRDLGIKNVRDIQTLQKLGDNYDVYARSVKDANQAFEEGVFLSQAYGVIQETVSAKLGVLQNRLNNLLAGLGESTTGPVKELLDLINSLLTRLQQFASNPAGKAITGLVVGVLALAAAVAAVNGVVALARASMLAYATAMGTAIIGANGLVVGLNAAATASRILGVTLKTVGIGIAITAATSAFAFLGDEIQRVVDRAGYLQRKTEELIGGFGGLQDAMTEDTVAMQKAADQVGMTLEQYAKMNGAIVLSTEAVRGNNDEIDKAIEANENLGIIIGKQPDLVIGTNGAIESQTIIIGENTQAWIKNAIASSDAFKEIAKNADVANILKNFGYDFEDALAASFSGTGEQYFNKIIQRYTATLNKLKAINPFDWAAIVNAQSAITQLEKVRDTFLGITVSANLLGLGPKLADSFELASDAAEELEDDVKNVGRELRTVLDYANDLRGVLQRVSDLKLNRQLVKDDIADGWQDIAEKAKSAESAIRSANAEIQGLTADRGVLEYQLSVAQRYGDEKRAAVIRAKLAKLDDKMANAQDDLADAQGEANKTLVGNTKAARDNRQAIGGMVDRYQDYIVALVQSGLKGKALADAIETLKRRFKEQAIAIGFAEDELGPYLETFDNFKEVVETMPRDVDIEVNLGISAAEQALKEFLAKKRGTNVDVTINDPDTKSYVARLRENLQSMLNNLPLGSDTMWGNYIRDLLSKINSPTITINPTRIALQGMWRNIARDTSSFWGQYLADALRTGSKQAILATANAGMASAGGSYFKRPAQSSYLYDYYRQMYTDALSMASGGLVKGPGTATSDSIPARLSDGEFVVRARAVKTYGLDFMNSINQMKPVGSMAGVGGGVVGAGGITIAQLSPEDRALLRAAVDRPINLYADSKKIAQTANDGNNLIARRGIR
jgi:TP901 family phage tail tape measure protein